MGEPKKTMGKTQQQKRTRQQEKYSTVQKTWSAPCNSLKKPNSFKAIQQQQESTSSQQAPAQPLATWGPLNCVLRTPQAASLQTVEAQTREENVAEEQRRREESAAQRRANKDIERKLKLARFLKAPPRQTALKEGQVEEEECSICLENMSEGVVRLSCGHRFHQCCAEEWLVNTPTCPICNATVVNKPETAPNKGERKRKAKPKPSTVALADYIQAGRAIPCHTQVEDPQLAAAIAASIRDL